MVTFLMGYLRPVHEKHFRNNTNKREETVTRRYSREIHYSAWLIADNFHGLFPTGRVNVQDSPNLTGSVLLPDTTCPVVSSTV